MKKILLAIGASSIIAFLFTVSNASALSTFLVVQGGTGRSTFTSSQLIYGNGTNALSSVATTTLTTTSPLSLSNAISVIGTTPSILTIATTTNSLFTGSLGQVLAYTDAGWTGVATTTFSGGLTYANGNVTCTGCTGGTVTAVTATWPIISSGGTTPNLTWGGLATSTSLSSNQIDFSTGVNTIGNSSNFIWDNANTRLGVASTSPAFTFSVNTIGSDFYIDSTGKVVAYDSTNGWNGRLSPTHSFVLGSATTTTWTASTTASAYTPSLPMPFAGTLRQVRCTPYVNGTAGSFLGVNVQVNGSNATPSYFVASSTVGVEKFTAGNTFTAGQQIAVNFGTTTTATATSISCTFDVTETP